MSSLLSNPIPSSIADENEVTILDLEQETMKEDDSCKKPRKKKLTSKVWFDMDRVKTATGIIAIYKHCKKKGRGQFKQDKPLEKTHR